ncbi:4466_t:CDS:10 [Paraglomus brasilianum]|uniref:U3 small nucleolar RNA-associated protein 22 n=1 Tax=Paraglomus brasilianum TaxID=144538 RepID=A0A9N9FFC9_9GLOM|nr:4466_t:CDS:10 [Paraglomus brasilianum]
MPQIKRKNTSALWQPKKMAKTDLPSSEEDSDSSRDYIEESDTSEQSISQDEKDRSEEDEYMSVDEEEEENGDHKPEGARSVIIKKKKNPLYKAPTNEEIQGLKETTDLFKSNIFRLQLDELLSEIRLDYTKHKHLESALHSLKSALDSLPPIPPQSLSEIKTRLLKQNIKIPFPIPAPEEKDVKYMFGFEKPTAVHLIGSYPLRTVIRKREGFSVDVGVVMPREKDYMNYRYFYKRAYYLAVLANLLGGKNAKTKFSVRFKCVNGDLRQTILVLDPSGDFSTLNCDIRIFPCIPPDLFPIKRLSPSRNNVRLHSTSTPLQSLTNGDSSTTTKSELSNLSSLPATSQYNTLILRDAHIISNFTFLHEHNKLCPAFKDACVIGKLWLYQRGFEQFNGFIWSMLLGYLLESGGINGGKKLSKGFSSYQLVRGVMDFLANHDFKKKPLFIKKNEAVGEFSQEVFTENFDVVFVDASGRLNLFGLIPKHALDQVQHEARLGMSYFNEVNEDRFEALFLRRVDDLKFRYDNIAKITHIPSTYPLYNDSSKLEYPDNFLHFARILPVLLSKALTDRVTLITTTHNNLPPWPVSSSPPSLATDASLYLCILLNHEQSTRLVDKGPPSNDEVAAENFQKLWGRKAETRRFKDGSIVESVVWEAKSMEEKALIVRQMVLHLLNLHFRIGEYNGVYYWAGNLDEFIRPSPIVPKRIYNPTTNDQGFQTVMHEYQEFSKLVTSIDNIPLQIESISSAHSALRYSSVFIPRPYIFSSHAAFSYIEPIEVRLHLEGSAKWPDDLVAIQKMKVAFYIRIAEKLCENGLNTVVVTNGKDSIEANDFMDVISQSGYGFRCRIYLERDKTLLERGIKDKRSTQTKKDEYTKALKKYRRLFVGIPMHTSHIHTLCNKYTSLSLTIRITKRWFSAHLLSPHIEEELIELLCAYIYLNPSPFAIPASGITGFLRVLYLLSHFDWKNEPLIVDIPGDMTSTRMSEIRAEFKRMRKSDEQIRHAAMYVVSGNNKEDHSWGWDTPERVVVARIQALASCALNHIDTAENEWKRLFVTPLNVYDAIIHVDPSKCTRYYENLNPSPKYFANDHLAQRSLPVIVGLDPVDVYINDLLKLYSNTALFFYDRYGGTMIGVLWKPTELSPRRWRATLEFSTMPEEYTSNEIASKNVVLNQHAILAEMERLGSGLVTHVEITK